MRKIDYFFFDSLELPEPPPELFEFSDEPLFELPDEPLLDPPDFLSLPSGFFAIEVLHTGVAASHPVRSAKFK